MATWGQNSTFLQNNQRDWKHTFDNSTSLVYLHLFWKVQKVNKANLRARTPLNYSHHTRAHTCTKASGRLYCQSEPTLVSRCCSSAVEHLGWPARDLEYASGIRHIQGVQLNSWRPVNPLLRAPNDGGRRCHLFKIRLRNRDIWGYVISSFLPFLRLLTKLDSPNLLNKCRLILATA